MKWESLNNQNFNSGVFVIIKSKAELNSQMKTLTAHAGVRSLSATREEKAL